MTIDIEKISNFLKGISVSDIYKWEIPFDNELGKRIFTQKDRKILWEVENFQGNVHLKNLLSKKIKLAKKINDIEALKQIFEWIVHDWGRIKNGRDKIDMLYELGREAIDKENLKFERIASISKILAFYNPSKYIIYDSRIAYSLNASMLFADASEKYFPVPAGRNTKLNAFDIEVLIRLKHKSKGYKRTENKKLISNADKTLFYNENEAYLMMNDAIQRINRELYKNEPEKQDKPFYTEMLLFGIAETIIYDTILKNVKIVIQKWEE